MAFISSSASRKNSHGHPTLTKQKGRRVVSIQAILLAAMTGAIGFYLGLMVGTVRSHGSAAASVVHNVQQQQTNNENNNGSSSSCSCLFATQKDFDEKVKLKVQKISQKHVQKIKTTDDTAKRFPVQVQDIAVGMGRVNRDDFAKTFDMGVPLDPSSPNNQEVLLFYSNKLAMPDNAFLQKEAVSMTEAPLLDVDDATVNCDYMNVILTDHGKARKQCVAIMGQYEAFHVQKYMRLPIEKAKMNSSVPLRLVNRGAQSSGRISTKPPSLNQTVAYWDNLKRYLGSLDQVLEELKPVAQSVAVNNTIIVLVCNLGQSQLLMNFVCNARRKGLDLSGILVFATDFSTLHLAQGLGLTAFYDKINYVGMPLRAAKRYADGTFMKMMMAKLYCVQMISMLGYDVLFQDVDVVWHKEPLAYFHNSTGADADFDVYFQDDGNHALYYAPYSANTGFYYVRNNKKTQHFFNSFLMAGDLITSTRSHQVPLVALLNEHASMYGMKVKIFSRDGNDFPGGHAFHRRKDLMKDIIAGAIKPFIFHMSWTTNSKNKLKFLQQLGEWYVKDECVDTSAIKILGRNFSKDGAMTGKLIEPCCAVEPIFECFYRDKPSLKPCKDSPAIDKNGKSWW